MAKRILASIVIFSLLISQSLLFFVPSVYAASSPWSQTDWSGGSGQGSWSDTSKFDTASGITTATSGQVTLTKQEQLTNTDFETDLTSWTASPTTFDDTSFAAASGAVAAWPLDDTTTIQSYARVVNPADSEGRDIVINGGFSSDTIWTKGTGWTINGVVVHSDGTQASSLLTQSIPTVIGKSYSVTFTVSNYVSGNVRPWLGSGSSGTLRSANGTYTETLTAAGSTAIWIQALNLVADIDNVSVKQVNIPASASFTGSELVTNSDFSGGLTGWTTEATPDTLEVTDGRLHVVETAAAYSGVSQNLGTIGKRYRFSCDYVVTSGTLRIDHMSGSNVAVTGSGTFIRDGVATTPYIYMRSSNAAAEFYIDNVSVVEINPLSGANTNGVTVGSTAYGHLTKAYSFDPTAPADFVNIYSSDLNSVFNPDAGTLMAWAKVTTSDNWNDGSTHTIIQIAGSSDSINMRKNADNTLQLYRVAGGTTKAVSHTPFSSTSFFMVTITWDQSADEVKAYVNGSQSGSTLTGIGAWTQNFGSSGVVIGAANTSGLNPWSGLINDVRLYNRALTPTEVGNLYSGISATRDTGTKYAGTASTKLISYEGYNGKYVQSVNVGDTNTYQLEAYAYTTGAEVTTSDLELYYGSTTLTTNITPTATAGWYKLTGTLTGADEVKDYGVLVKGGKTVYVDNLSLWNYPTSATLTSSIFDTEQTSDWGVLTYTATTPANTAATVKVRTSNNSDMNGATVFASCTAISSSSDISSNSCVTDGQRYVQYEVTLADTDYLSTPTFSDFSLTFTKSAVSVTLDSPGDKTYTSSQRPTFKWKVGVGDENLVSYTLQVDNGDTGDFAITNIPTSRTSDYEMPKFVVHYDGFGDTDDTNNYISVYTKSSTEWGSTENDGLAKEGKRIWTVKGVDATGIEYSESRTLFVDRTSPYITIEKINDASFSSGTFQTSDTTPTISGRITDPLATGDNSTATQDENGPRVASGPKEVTIKIEKKEGLIYKVHTLYTINLDKPFYTCDNTELSDNSKQKCDKYNSFSYSPKESLSLGSYKISLTGKDKADNSSSETSFLLNVSTFAQIATPQEQETIKEEIKKLPSEEQEKALEEVEITKPQEPSVFENIAEKIVNVGQNTIAYLISFVGDVADGIGDGIQFAFKTVSEGYQFVTQATADALAFVGDSAITLIDASGKLMAFTGGKFIQGISALGQGAQSLLATIGNAVATLGQGAQSLLAAIGVGLGDTGKAIGDWYDNLANRAPGVTKTMLTGIREGIVTLASAIGWVTNTLASTTATFAQNTTLAFGNIVSITTKTTTTITQTVGGTIASVFRSTTSTAFTIAQSIGHAFSSTTNAIVITTNTIVKSTWLTIASITQTGVRTVKQGISSMAFIIGESTQNVSEQAGFAIVKFGYLFVNEPTQITNVQVELLSATSAKVTWQTNHPANGKVNYGLDRTYPFDAQSEKRITQHEFILTDLQPDTIYYFEVMSQNKNYVYDANREFRTSPQP